MKTDSEEFIMVDGCEQSAIKPSQLERFFMSFQLMHQPTTAESCPLCQIEAGEEYIHYQCNDFLIVDMRDKKGHRERIMVLTRRHGVQHTEESLNRAIQQLVAVAG